MTVIENVLIGMHARLSTGAVGAMLRTHRVMREEREAAENAFGLLDYVGLSRHAQVTARSLSYGDQRRLEVARALASSPSLLLLDEPTAGMNPRETAGMTTFINKMRRDLNLTILLIEHDMKVVMGISDHVVVLDHGIKIADGTGTEVRSNPQVVEAYLGKGAAELQRQFDTPVVEIQQPSTPGVSE
jgi:branched-chain amino acid transport system ATP-binding protein